VPDVPAEAGLVVEDTESGFCGAVVGTEKGPEGHVVTLEDRHGRRRSFPLGAGFLLEGRHVALVRPVAPAGARPPRRTASGSVAVPHARARVARDSRIYVEGRHDAELVEKVWGDDLRVEGVVVEHLGGIDDLADHLRDFAPGPCRRAGVLVDHLVAGSKESRIAEAVSRSDLGAHVLVVGHPFVDVWQAVKPERLGMPEWPTIPRGRDWKHGICDHLGWPHADQADIARAWQHILSRVSSYGDLEPAFLGRVEELIDFVTAP
jgi:hypothetical protein